MNKGNINTNDVKKLYNNMEEIWPLDDKWYQYTYKRIEKYLKYWETKLYFNESTSILNAGSGGNTYGIKGIHTHLDISEKHLEGIKNAIIANIENVPIVDNSFDVCICVGSVINYCNVIAAISEFSRVLKKDGYLILDFDQSKNYEFIGTNTFDSNLDIVETFNSGYRDKIWVYSEKYICKILQQYNFSIINKEYYHTISSLIYKILHDEQKAAGFVSFDKLTKHIPYIRKISNNIILIAKKI